MPPAKIPDPSVRLWNNGTECHDRTIRRKQSVALRTFHDVSIQIMIPPKLRPLFNAALPDRELDAGARPDAKGRISSVEKAQSG